MSTRVQKGGPVFRPVAKSRARSVADTTNARQHIPTPGISIPSAVPHPLSPPQQGSDPVAVDTYPSSQHNNTITPAIHSARVSVIPQPRGRRPKRQREISNSDPAEDLDPTVVTMATLCDDTGQGRVSSKASQIHNNHLAWKTSSREKRVCMRARMEAKKFGREENEENTTQTSTPSSEPPRTNSTPGPSSGGNDDDTVTATQDATGSGFDYSEALSTSRFNVQVRIGPNGETIIDENSLFVDRAVDDDSANYTHVEESDATKFVNSGTYGKRYRGSRWSPEETELFFDALSQFGENYELISYILPGRDRKSCKNKFKAEDKKNPARITSCLNHRVPYDIQTLSRMTGKDFSGPMPEIRARAVVTLAESAPPTEDQGSNDALDHPDVINKPSLTPALLDAGEEVLGDISSFE